MSMILRHATALFHSYPQVLLMPGSRIGLLLFAVTLVSPQMALSGLVAVLGAYGLARIMQLDVDYLKSGHQTYNPLLVGLFLGAHWQLSILTVALIVAAGGVTFLITQMMSRILSLQYNLPVLSLPFVISSWVLSLAMLQYMNISPVNENASLMPFLPLERLEQQCHEMLFSHFFRAMGAIFFLPSVLVGLLFSIMLLCHSRILFILAVSGFYLGVGSRGMMTGSFEEAMIDPNAFNYILVAMAIGGIFLIPSPSSYLLALIGVLITTLFIDAGRALPGTLGIHAYPLPFNLVTIMLLGALSMAGFNGLMPLIQCAKQAPEDNLANLNSYTMRHPGTLRTLRLPFHGIWTVWQAESGPWTHQGPWKHAYDFVITQHAPNEEVAKPAGLVPPKPAGLVPPKPAGLVPPNPAGLDLNHLTYHIPEAQDRPAQLTDFYCFRKPVISPINGKVVQVVSHLPDCLPGQPDLAQPWGNSIVIEDPRGFFVNLSHFAKDTIRVNVGDWVKQGSIIGLCGNSGNSPQPHLHVQVQQTPHIGSATLPFSFTSFISYKSDGITYHSNTNPRQHARVEAGLMDEALNTSMTLMLDQRFCYEVNEPEGTSYLYLKVKMAEDGQFYLDALIDKRLTEVDLLQQSGDARLYFSKVDGTFYLHHLEDRAQSVRKSETYQALRHIYIAMARLPLSLVHRQTTSHGHVALPIQYEDVVPLRYMMPDIKRRLLASLIGPFFPKLTTAVINYEWKEGRILASNAPGQSVSPQQIQFDEGPFFASLIDATFELSRLNDSCHTASAMTRMHRDMSSVLSQTRDNSLQMISPENVNTDKTSKVVSPSQGVQS